MVLNTFLSSDLPRPYYLLGIEYKSKPVAFQIMVGFSYICCPNLLFLCLFFFFFLVFLFVLLVFGFFCCCYIKGHLLKRLKKPYFKLVHKLSLLECQSFLKLEYTFITKHFSEIVKWYLIFFAFNKNNKSY